MIKIGDFSRISQVSVKTLRYYDEVGLLKPVQVDPFSGYRYYSLEQLPRLNRILAFKDLGFSLEQIAGLLDENLPPAQIRGMLRLKRAEIQQHLAEEQARLARVESRLLRIEMEDTMSDQEIIIKKVAPLRIAGLRAVIPNFGSQGPLWDELEKWLASANCKPVSACITVYHDTEYREQDVEVEVCEPVDAALPEHPRIQVHELPGVETMASTIHTGSYDNFGSTYDTLIQWIEANGYQICGPNREIYLHNILHTKNPDEFLTEVQFPVTRA